MRQRWSRIDGLLYREYWYVHPLVAELRTGSNWCGACSRTTASITAMSRSTETDTRDSLFDGSDLRASSSAASSSSSSMDRPASLWPVERNVVRWSGRARRCCYERSFHARLTLRPPRPAAEPNRRRGSTGRRGFQLRPSPTSAGPHGPRAIRRPTSDHSTTTMSMMIMIVDAAPGQISGNAVHCASGASFVSAWARVVRVTMIMESYWWTHDDKTPSHKIRRDTTPLHALVSSKTMAQTCATTGRQQQQLKVFHLKQK